VIKAILGKKLGMTHIFEKDTLIPVTLVEAGPCVIVQKKVQDKDGYGAIQIGFNETKKLNKPKLGYFKKREIPSQKYLREIRMKDMDKYQAGGEIRVDIFEEGDLVSVSGISKGKGFAGVVKRYGFKGGPASHGAKQWHRRPGSIGASADPSRVFKGKKMPGRMGREKVTIHNLKVVKVDEKENLLLIEGSLPGKKGDLLTIKGYES